MSPVVPWSLLYDDNSLWPRRWHFSSLTSLPVYDRRFGSVAHRLNALLPTLYVTSSSCGHHYDHIRRWPRRWPFISRHRICSTGVWGRSHPDSTYCFHRPSLALRRLFRGPSAGAVWRNVTLLIGCIHRPASNCYFRNQNSRNKGNCLSCHHSPSCRYAFSSSPSFILCSRQTGNWQYTEGCSSTFINLPLYSIPVRRVV